MPAVDYERAWVRLKAKIAEKGSHGQRDLLAEMGRIEVDCELPEGERLFDATPLPRRTDDGAEGGDRASSDATREVAAHA